MYRQNTYLLEVYKKLMELSEDGDYKSFKVVCPRLQREKSLAETRQAIYKVAKEAGIEVITIADMNNVLFVRRVA